MLVGAQQGCVHGAEAAVQGRGEAAADAGETPPLHFFHIHGLEKHPVLHAVFQAAAHPALHIHIQVHGKAYAADRVNHADALGGHKIDGFLHVFYQLHRGYGVSNRIGYGKERLLVHFARIRVQ